MWRLLLPGPGMPMAMEHLLPERCYLRAMPLCRVSPQQAEVIVRAASTVATIGGTVPLSAADRRGITGALATVFGDDSDRDLEKLESISSGEVVRVLEDDGLRLDLLRVLAVLALLDGMVEKGKIELVLDFATALHVHAEFVDALHQLQIDHARWVGYDMIRANVFTIPGVPWGPDDPYGPFLPYGSPSTDRFTCGSLTSAEITSVGSIGNFGSILWITTSGGVNCRGAILGRRPLLAGSGERSPEPPPPRPADGT